MSPPAMSASVTPAFRRGHRRQQTPFDTRALCQLPLTPHQSLIPPISEEKEVETIVTSSAVVVMATMPSKPTIVTTQTPPVACMVTEAVHRTSLLTFRFPRPVMVAARTSVLTVGGPLRGRGRSDSCAREATMVMAPTAAETTKAMRRNSVAMRSRSGSLLVAPCV